MQLFEMRGVGRIKEKFLYSNKNVSTQYLNSRPMHLYTSITLVLCLEIIWGVCISR